MIGIRSNKNLFSLSALASIAILYYALNIPNALYVPIGAIFATIIVFRKGMGGKIISTNIVIVALFCVLIFYFDSFTGYSQYAKIIYGYTLFIMYLLGTCISYQDNNNQEIDNIEPLFNILYYGLFFFIIVCVLYTYLKGYRFSAEFRSPIIIWNNEFGRSTHFGTLTTVPLSISILKVAETDKRERFGHICIMVSLIIANLLMSNRIIILFLAVFLASLFIIKNKNKTFGSLILALVGWLSLIFMLYSLYLLNETVIRTVLSNVPLFSRMQDLYDLDYSDPRMERQLYIITHFLDCIRGGGYFYDIVDDPHNVWLDIYDRSGIIPFLLFFFFTAILIRKIVFLLSDTRNAKMNSLCIVVLIGFLISFTEESVFRSTPTFMILFFFCSGAIIGYCNKYSNDKYISATAE